MEDIVFVDGNICFKSGNHLVKEVFAYVSDEWKKDAEYINGDLVITKEDELMPYMIYCASEDVSFENITFKEFVLGDSVLQRPDDVIKTFQEEIDNLKRLKDQKVNIDLTDVLNRQIYIGVVGTMELFLSDFLFCMVLGYRKYYNRFCESSSRTFSLKEISNKRWKIQDGVSKAILETNYHRLGEVAKIYKRALGLEFPSFEKLEKKILTRHNLVHRNGYPSKKSEYIKVDHKMIDELIVEVQMLVEHIIEKMKTEIDNWLPVPTKK